MGSVVSPPLSTGVIFDNFNISGMMPCSRDWLYTFVNALFIYIYSQAYLTYLIGVLIVDLFPFKITIKSCTSYSLWGRKKSYLRMFHGCI